ncbi:hypothetical protein OGAPHI_007435 [Ogataea philodendri]|uniref:Uncharacterized protein n=1 Tax=Ogataea philodendri TaxID=1378263 RepID=A0A9P8SZU3_9ASCO|nr:uncharacterized protein OGAPHI_007435 [Ogataea philodendri]KAH3660230.1 hypothetical protein OGAPHI_007435 [Ogataea philodendri]
MFSNHAIRVLSVEIPLTECSLLKFKSRSVNIGNHLPRSGNVSRPIADRFSTVTFVMAPLDGKTLPLKLSFCSLYSPETRIPSIACEWYLAEICTTLVGTFLSSITGLRSILNTRSSGIPWRSISEILLKLRLSFRNELLVQWKLVNWFLLADSSVNRASSSSPVSWTIAFSSTSSFSSSSTDEKFTVPRRLLPAIVRLWSILKFSSPCKVSISLYETSSEFRL